MTDFTDKYKPTTLKEYRCDDKLKNSIKSYIENNSRKPIIFYGPAGTGKTTLAQVMCNEMGAHMYNVNASMENGVDKIREDVIAWARNNVISSNGLKMIFFDEAEGLTIQSQNALKRTIDDYSKNTIFVFCTNNIHKIIEPLKSRASSTTFHIGYVSDSIIEALLVDVMGKISDNSDVYDSLDKIIKAAHGEPRRAVNLLQSYVDGNFVVPEDNQSKFAKLIDGISHDVHPLELVQFITENDLNEFSEFIFGDLETNVGYSAKDSLKVIADTDRAMQHSINKDVHLLNMIIRLSEL